MISAKFLLKQTEKFAVDNAPTILTVIGAGGAIGTTFLAVKATFKASELIRKEQLRVEQMTPDLDVKEIDTKAKIKVVWKEYIPTAGALVTTVTCVVCANRITTKRIAAMAAAYSISERAFGEYRDKVAEKFNPNKERQVRDELAQDRVDRNPPKESQIIFTGHGEVTCYDQPSGRYFKSTQETIRQIQNDINEQVIEDGEATLSDFYVALHLPPTPWSEELGWKHGDLLNIQFSAVLENGQPVIAIDHFCKPIRENAGFLKGDSSDPPF